MLGHKENFPATGENSDDVGIRMGERGNSHVLFCAKELVEAFGFRVFIHKDDLSAILDHAMASIAEKCKDSLLGVVFAEAIQFVDNIVAVFNLGFYQGLELIRTESESGDQFLEVAVVSVYAR